MIETDDLILSVTKEEPAWVPAPFGFGEVPEGGGVAVYDVSGQFTYPAHLSVGEALEELGRHVVRAYDCRGEVAAAILIRDFRVVGVRDGRVVAEPYAWEMTQG